ncbi:MAG: hypothetical protein WAO91_05935 [Candidatus Nitrosotenuis sp.]
MEELSEQKKAELRHIAKITYEAMLEGTKKYDEYKKAKAAARLAKKSKYTLNCNL